MGRGALRCTSPLFGASPFTVCVRVLLTVEGLLGQETLGFVCTTLRLGSLGLSCVVYGFDANSSPGCCLAVKGPRDPTAKKMF